MPLGVTVWRCGCRSNLELAERRELRRGLSLLGLAPARHGVAVAAADRAEAPARLLAQRLQRDREQDLVADLVGEIELAAREGGDAVVLELVVVLVGGHERHGQRNV